MPDNIILETAIAAHQAGLCPIRAATDGSKRPLGRWKDYQETRPDLADVMAGFAHSENIGLVCGAVSDRLICLEFEGRFMEEWETAVTYLDGSVRSKTLGEASSFDQFRTWIDGYSERTPSGGIHILIHYGGDDPVPGNTKIAMNAEGETLIETRGEGGFVIVAPSNGSTHPSGGAWSLESGSFEDIAWVTPEEYEFVVDFLGDRFDQSPPSEFPPTPSARPRQTLSGSHKEWINDEITLLDLVIEEELLLADWTFVRQEPLGSLWRRPGKTDHGHSARVNNNGRLIVFTSTGPLAGYGRRTFDALDVKLAHSGNRGSRMGAPTPEERVEFLTQVKAQRRRREAQASRALVAAPVDEPEPAADSPVSPDTCLPPEFWAARPYLQAIYDTALEQILAPEGVLGAFLSSYATTIPMSIRIPKVMGMPSPLNTYVALVDRSGGGKTTSMALALELLGYPENLHPDVLLGRSLRSGEGLITLALRPKTKDDPDPGHRQAVQVVFDEGGALGAQASRQGSTTLPYLNTAWAGLNVVGGALATGSASFHSSHVRICAVMGVQYGAAANLFTGEAEKIGFPQRLLYFTLNNPVLGEMILTEGNDDPIEPVGVVFWEHGDYGRKPITVPMHIRMEVREWSRARKAHSQGAILDAHQKLIQLRTAALFALMDGRADVNDEDWHLADCICATSRAVRSALIQSLGDVADERSRALGRGDVVRSEAAEIVWLDNRAKRIAGYLHGVEDGLTRKSIKDKLNRTERPRLTEILDYGIAEGLFVQSDGRYFRGVKPKSGGQGV